VSFLNDLFWYIFILQHAQCLTPIFLFVVDTCIDDEEVGVLKDTLLKCLLVCFPPVLLLDSSHLENVVHVHELGCVGISKSCVLGRIKI
jgi:protein transport protein SEC23